MHIHYVIMHGDAASYEYQVLSTIKPKHSPKEVHYQGKTFPVLTQPIPQINLAQAKQRIFTGGNLTKAVLPSVVVCSLLDESFSTMIMHLLNGCFADIVFS